MTRTDSYIISVSSDHPRLKISYRNVTISCSFGILYDRYVGVDAPLETAGDAQFGRLLHIIN